MILGSNALREALRAERIQVFGDKRFCSIDWDDVEVGPASIDLTLADECLTPLPNRRDELFGPVTEAARPVQYNRQDGLTQLVIPARGFCLARTQERIALDRSLTGFVEGRSSVGRLGLFIQNAGWVDPGFDGTITLELFNALPNAVVIPVGIRICQLVVAEADGAEAYRGKYQGQLGTRGSELWKDC